MGLTRITLAVATLALAAVVAPSAATGAKPSYGCAPGFNLGAFTLDDYLELPRTAAAIDAGLIDAETLKAALAAQVDHNDNEVICVQLNHGLEVSSRPFGEFIYNVVDDNASVPG
jgi:hypothetical protein